MSTSYSGSFREDMYTPEDVAVTRYTESVHEGVFTREEALLLQAKSYILCCQVVGMSDRTVAARSDVDELSGRLRLSACRLSLVRRQLSSNLRFFTSVLRELSLIQCGDLYIYMSCPGGYLGVNRSTVRDLFNYKCDMFCDHGLHFLREDPSTCEVVSVVTADDFDYELDVLFHEVDTNVSAEVDVTRSSVLCSSAVVSEDVSIADDVPVVSVYDIPAEVVYGHTPAVVDVYTPEVVYGHTPAVVDTVEAGKDVYIHSSVKVRCSKYGPRLRKVGKVGKGGRLFSKFPFHRSLLPHMSRRPLYRDDPGYRSFCNLIAFLSWLVSCVSVHPGTLSMFKRPGYRGEHTGVLLSDSKRQKMVSSSNGKLRDGYIERVVKCRRPVNEVKDGYLKGKVRDRYLDSVVKCRRPVNEVKGGYLEDKVKDGYLEDKVKGGYLSNDMLCIDSKCNYITSIDRGPVPLICVM